LEQSVSHGETDGFPWENGRQTSAKGKGFTAKGSMTTKGEFVLMPLPQWGINESKGQIIQNPAIKKDG